MNKPFFIFKEKCELEFKATKTINSDVWLSLNNNTKYGGLPPCSRLTQIQSEELKAICSAMKQHLDAIGIPTQHYSIRKTQDGYKFSRTCNDCKARINLEIKFSSLTGIISLYNECKSHK